MAAASARALPGALGVKLAHPGRPVVAISGDGSAMYSIQALWTAAHHDLAVVFVILDNREYRILKHNMDVYRQRFGVRTDRPYVHMDLTGPELSFVDIARGMGVAGTRVTRPATSAPRSRPRSPPASPTCWTSWWKGGASRQRHAGRRSARPDPLKQR